MNTIIITGIVFFSICVAFPPLFIPLAAIWFFLYKDTQNQRRSAAIALMKSELTEITHGEASISIRSQPECWWVAAKHPKRKGIEVKLCKTMEDYIDEQSSFERRGYVTRIGALKLNINEHGFGEKEYVTAARALLKH